MKIVAVFELTLPTSSESRMEHSVAPRCRIFIMRMFAILLYPLLYYKCPVMAPALFNPATQGRSRGTYFFTPRTWRRFAGWCTSNPDEHGLKERLYHRRQTALMFLGRERMDSVSVHVTAA